MYPPNVTVFYTVNINGAGELRRRSQGKNMACDVRRGKSTEMSVTTEHKSSGMHGEATGFQEGIEREQMFLATLSDPTRDRTWNLLLRRQAPYPLGHRTDMLVITMRVCSANMSGAIRGQHVL